MPSFIYNIEKNGKLAKGEVRAKNLQLARLKLRARNIDPVYIKQKPFVPFFAGGGGVKTSVVLFFTRQLSFLLSSGVSLVQAIQMSISTTENENFKQVLRSLLKQLESGKSFSRCLRAFPQIFDGFYVNMIVCAEETGLMDQVLKDLADYMEKSEAVKSRVKSVMMYPIVVLFISVSIILGIIWFIVPKFEALYAGSGSQLPFLTQAFVDLSHLLRDNFIIFFAFLIGVPVAIYQYIKTESGNKQFKALLKTFPLFGKIQYEAGLVRFFRSFYSLLKAGVNFLDALDVTHKIAGHEDVQKGISISRDFVTKGKSFSKGLETSRAFPPLVYNMVKIGEESGKMDITFEKLSTFYEERLNNLISGLIKMIEPLLIVVLGGIVGVMILALYLPVFNMGSIVN